MEGIHTTNCDSPEEVTVDNLPKPLETGNERILQTIADQQTPYARKILLTIGLLFGTWYSSHLLSLLFFKE